MNAPARTTEAGATGCIRLSALASIIEDCCRAGGIEFDEGSWREHQSGLDEILDRQEQLKGTIFRLYGDRLGRTLYRDKRFYEPGALVVNSLHLLVDSADWSPFLRFRGLFSSGLHFENCTIEVENVGKEVISLLFARQIYFRQTTFVSSLRSGRVHLPPLPAGFGHLPSTWLVNLCTGCSITFERCYFGRDHVQIRCLGSPEDTHAKGVRSSHAQAIPENGRGGADIPSDKGNTIRMPPEVPSEFDLDRVAFYGNRDLGAIDLVSTTEELILRAGNRIEALRLPGSHPFRLPSRISLGLSEAIDPECRDPLHHRDVFQQFRRLATDNQDRPLSRASTAQIDRIEHFLIWQDRITHTRGVGPFIDHWQRRFVLSWGYWVSDFNRSWLRCLGWLVLLHLLLGFVACLLLWQHLDGSGIVEIVFRPLHRIPFLVQAAEDYLGRDAWKVVATGSKISLHLIGIASSVLTGLFTFSLIKSLRP